MRIENASFFLARGFAPSRPRIKNSLLFAVQRLNQISEQVKLSVSEMRQALWYRRGADVDYLWDWDTIVADNIELQRDEILSRLTRSTT